MGTCHVLKACRRLTKVKRIVVASSDKAYGSNEDLPYTEQAALQGEFPYDVSKSCADLIAQSYQKTYGLPVGITRCGNLYGGGDLNFSRIVPGTIRSLLRDEPVIIRSDGNYIRDYFYVKDAVSSYLALAQALDEEAFHGQAFNFGTNKPLSVKALVEKIIEVGGHKDPRVDILNEASNEIREQYLLSRKAEELLGWGASYSIETALKETINWYRSHLQRIET